MTDKANRIGDVGTDRVPVDIPDEFMSGDSFGEAGERGPSLIDDIVNLLDDTKTYFEAEANFQKSRGGYIANRLKYAAGYAAAAFGFFHLALIALTVGVVIALAPLVGPWLATLIVGGVLIMVGFFLLQALRSKIDDVRSAFDRAEP